MAHCNKQFKKYAEIVLRAIPVGTSFTSAEFLEYYKAQHSVNHLNVNLYRVSAWLKWQPNLEIERSTYRPYRYTKVSE